MLNILKRVFVGIVVTFTTLVFALYAYNFYRNWKNAPDPDAQPGIIFERQNRPGYS